MAKAVKELSDCIKGSTPQRKGVADTVAQLVTKPIFTEKCMPLVTRLLDDDEQTVRQGLMIIVRMDSFFDLPWAPNFVTLIVRSKARNDDWHLLWKLADVRTSLEPFAEAIFAISDAVAEVSRSPSPPESHWNWEVDELMLLLLRLYERSSGPSREAIRQRCLDAWDTLLESRAALAWELTRGLESGCY